MLDNKVCCLANVYINNTLHKPSISRITVLTRQMAAVLSPQHGNHRFLPWSLPQSCTWPGLSDPPQHFQTKSWKLKLSLQMSGKDPQPDDTVPEDEEVAVCEHPNQPTVSATCNTAFSRKLYTVTHGRIATLLYFSDYKSQFFTWESWVASYIKLLN